MGNNARSAGSGAASKNGSLDCVRCQTRSRGSLAGCGRMGLGAVVAQLVKPSYAQRQTSSTSATSGAERSLRSHKAAETPSHLLPQVCGAKPDQRGSSSAFLRVLTSCRKGARGELQGVGDRRKVRRMTWCLAEAIRNRHRAFLREADQLGLHQDKRGAKLLIRFTSVNASLQRRSGVLGFLPCHGGHLDIIQSTEQAIRIFCSPGSGAPRRSHLRGSPGISGDLELQHGRVADRARPLLPNLKVVGWDGAHAARRIVQRPWLADATLKEDLRMAPEPQADICGDLSSWGTRGSQLRGSSCWLRSPTPAKKPLSWYVSWTGRAFPLRMCLGMCLPCCSASPCCLWTGKPCVAATSVGSSRLCDDHLSCWVCLAKEVAETEFPGQQDSLGVGSCASSSMSWQPPPSVARSAGPPRGGVDGVDFFNFWHGTNLRRPHQQLRRFNLLGLALRGRGEADSIRGDRGRARRPGDLGGEIRAGPPQPTACPRVPLAMGQGRHAPGRREPCA